MSFDFSNARVEAVTIHQVGNKLKEEILQLSESVVGSVDAELEHLLQRFFFHGFKSSDEYAFYHDTDLRFNPLASLQTTNLLISVKHRESYPATPAQRVSKFKEFLKDIAEAAECFPSAANEFPPISGTTSIRNICVILWINEAADALNTSVVPDIATFRNTDIAAFDTVYLVDNRQAAFLHDSIKYAQNSDASFCFYYPDTGSNMNTVQRIHQGKVLPVEYVTSPILLFKLSSTEGNKLLLTTSQQYSKERLSRILQLARLITENWASGITIAFRDYRDYDSKAEVEACLNELHDPAFKRQVQVVNLPADDFRNMGGNNNA